MQVKCRRRMYIVHGTKAMFFCVCGVRRFGDRHFGCTDSSWNRGGKTQQPKIHREKNSCENNYRASRHVNAWPHPSVEQKASHIRPAAAMTNCEIVARLKEQCRAKSVRSNRTVAIKWTGARSGPMAHSLFRDTTNLSSEIVGVSPLNAHFARFAGRLSERLLAIANRWPCHDYHRVPAILTVSYARTGARCA